MLFVYMFSEPMINDTFTANIAFGTARHSVHDFLALVMAFAHAQTERFEHLLLIAGKVHGLPLQRSSQIF
jgi:hypothetical protein